ncbi:aldo/keto reductase [Kribbella sp. NBC_00382]
MAQGGHATSRVVTAIADELGAMSAQISLAWLLHRSPVMVPIPETKSIDHLQENVAAARSQLTPEQLTRLAGAGNS